MSSTSVSPESLLKLAKSLTPEQWTKLTDDEVEALDEVVAAYESKRSISFFPQYANDPVLFAIEVLGIEPWTRQAEILRAVAERPKVAVRSGHKVGKSTRVVIFAPWGG